LLGLGETVILDASWADRAYRRQALALAAQTRAAAVQLRCTAAPATVAARLARRGADGPGTSDADRTVAAALAADADAWPEAHVVTTDESGHDTRAVAAIRAVDVPPRGQT
jgi:predicted kinase